MDYERSLRWMIVFYKSFCIFLHLGIMLEETAKEAHDFSERIL